jgi:hypothetical protein
MIKPRRYITPVEEFNRRKNAISLQIAVEGYIYSICFTSGVLLKVGAGDVRIWLLYCLFWRQPYEGLESYRKL